MAPAGGEQKKKESARSSLWRKDAIFPYRGVAGKALLRLDPEAPVLLPESDSGAG